MKDKKTELRFFSITEWEKEQNYLQLQHKKGWKLVKVILPGFYFFEKCEPEEVVYQLDFNPEGINHKAEYVQMFQDCGWEYLMDSGGYSYFRKPISQMQECEEIFCDNASRLEMINRVFKGRMIPLIIIFFAIVVPQLVLQANLKSSFAKNLFYAYLMLFILYLLLFIHFIYQFWQLRRRLK